MAHETTSSLQASYTKLETTIDDLITKFHKQPPQSIDEVVELYHKLQNHHQESRLYGTAGLALFAKALEWTLNFALGIKNRTKQRDVLVAAITKSSLIEMKAIMILISHRKSYPNIPESSISDIVIQSMVEHKFPRYMELYLSKMGATKVAQLKNHYYDLITREAKQTLQEMNQIQYNDRL